MRSVRWMRLTGAALLVVVGLPLAGVAPAAQAATTPVTSGVGLAYGGPGHTFSAGTAGPGGSLVRAWSRSFGGPVSTPLVVGSAVVTAATSSGTAGTWVDLQAFDGVSGTPLWPPLAV